MYIDGVDFILMMSGFMFAGVALNEFARWVVKRADNTKYEFDERLR